MATSNAKVSDVNSGNGEDEFPDELQQGMKLLGGQYTIVKFLNSGGFGITYLAKDSLDRDVVIKECFPDSICRRSSSIVRARSRAHKASFASIVDLFVQEARSQAKLVHPNIVGVHQVFNDNDTAYMAIDYVNGGDLLDKIENEDERPPEDVEYWLRQTLNAIGFIHDDGMLHRDISPDNILINEKNEPILIDFGAAREQASKTNRVLSTMRVVKDGYSPQEFYVSGSAQSPASDLYALGATFYHVVTGDAPADSQTRLAAIASGDDDVYAPLAGNIKGYPEAFLASIDKALKVLPKDRHQSAQDWLSEMDGKADAKTGAAANSNENTKAPKKKGKTLLLGAVSAAAVVAAGFVVMNFGLGEGTTLLAPNDKSTADPTVTAGDVAAVVPEVVASDEAAVDPIVTANDDAATEPEVVANDVPTSEPEVVASDETTTEDPSASVEDAAGDETPAEVAAEVTEPAEVPVAPQSEDVESKPAPIVISAATLAAQKTPEIDSALISSAEWTVDTPFETTGISLREGNFAQITMVRSNLDPEARTWLASGGIIYSVNGIIVYDSPSIVSAIEQSSDFSGQRDVTVNVRVRASEDAPLEDKSLTLPIQRAVELPNGFRFATTRTATGWQTRVARVPADTETSLRVGDVIISEALTNTVMSAANDIELAISKLGESSAKSAYFTISRKGKLDSATVQLNAQ